LNGLRFFSAFAVIFEHVRGSAAANAHVPVSTSRLRILDFGWLGVDMFFVLSGFLIVTLILRERRQTGRISLKNFYARRSLRIFPIYYLLIAAALCFYALISPWLPNGLRYYAWTFPVLATYTQDIIMVPLGVFNPTWSLAIEEQFYLIWPAIEKAVSRTGKWLLFGLFLLANQLVNFGFAKNLISQIYGTESATRLPLYLITFTPVLMGVLLAHVLNSRPTFSVLFAVFGNKFAAMVVVFLLVACIQFFPEDLQGLPRLITHFLMGLLICSLVVFPDNLLRPLLDHSVAAKLGAISYGIYLYHLIVLSIVSAVLARLGLTSPNVLLLTALTTGFTILIAGASYRFIEIPFLMMKVRFARQPAHVL
jgi:peptidoglycan/LPS O-acetylase OafA/YrhL